ncbi:unnamed protein product, partial [Durusdinium trenchii]
MAETSHRTRYCSLSSCSGRAFLWRPDEEGLVPKKPRVSESWRLLAAKGGCFSQYIQGFHICHAFEDWRGGFEPLVLHVACRSLPEACQLVAQAQLAFPKSSLLSFRKRFVVQILGEDYVEPWPFSREVDKVFLFKEHVILWQRQALAESRDCHLATAPIILQYQCFTPSVRVLTEELFFRELGNEGDLSLELLCERLGSRLADVLERCGWVIPVLWVPKPIMLLLVQGKWKALVLHMMNSVPNRDAPLFQRHCLNWLRDLMQYPSNGCFSCLWGNRFQQYRSPNHPLTSACALFAMQQLRAHSSAIIADGGPSSQSRLEETLEGLEIFTQSLVENRQAGSHVTGRKAVASRIFDDIRAAHLLRNRGHFKAMKTAMMRSLMPHQLQSLAKAMMYDPLSVYMDCTFAVLFRDVLDSNFGPVYLWCDSSPQAGVDWLLSIIDYIAEDHLEECHQKYQALYRSTSLIQQSVEDVNLLAEIAVNRADAIKFLRQKLHRHRQMPMGLGSGASKLENKCQALAMKLAHETHSFQALRRVAKQIVSVTVDMGVESGVADAQGGDVVSYLPPWMAAQDCLQEDAGLDAVEVSSDRLFPRSLLAAGLDHISNNLLSDMDQHLQCWDGWLPGFKALAHLLSHKHLLSRLVGRCILGTPHQALARMFETCIEPIAKWRWGTIVKTLPSVLRLERGLRIVWDEQKFLARGETMQSQGQDDSFDCSLITKTIQDNSWWAMSHMLLHLHSIGNLASAWGSSCHCHEWITEKPESQHFAMSEALHRTLETLRLEKGLDGANVDCPLKGKRAPELAAGMLMPRINELVEHCTSDVLLACSSVSAEQREKVVNDFTLGVDYIRMTLDVKLGHWATLPWLLAALSLPEPSVQHKAIAQRAIEEFDKLPAIPIHHHQLTWQILNPSSTLRSQLEAVAQGALLASLPGLASEVARLSFVPVVERIVEGAHSLVHRHTGYRKISGAYVSCSHRLPEMEAILDTDDGLENFCAAFEQLRKPRQLAKKFRLQDHPLWLELTSKPPKQQSGVQKLLKSIVYSTDAHTMYVDHAMSRKQHDKRQCAAIKAKLAVNPKPKIALTQDSVMQHALVQHVQEMLIPG